ncbi:MAG TPA: hydantoinase B/oxoprolinase family protein, partial [Chloroflexi bacterium]|nr:hydantoinase B/oxoprolinase family protein [Chloroflexota bacterium]
MAVDLITAEVVAHGLQSIVEEMGVALVRSAYSTNIKERRDCSCALFAPDGQLVALAEHIPIHLGSMQGLMAQIAEDLGAWALQPGDVIIANDPYQGGGSHLPDVTLLQPVFHEGELVAFVTNIAHWSDVGGRSPGVGTAGDSTEVWQEGLRIPPIRIVAQGRVRHDLLDLLLLNMRDREERLGDFRAQIAALRLGERRLLELFRRYGAATMAASIAELLDYSERRLRTALCRLPEGTYRFADAMDDDGVSEEPLPIQVAVTVSHHPEPTIAFDFTGTAPQAAGGINMVRSALLATVYYTVKAVVAPDVPPNAGFQRPIRVHAPEGSLVNAREPAAVGGRTDTCQRVVDAILGALSQAVPERVVAASNGATTAIIFGGTEPLSGRSFVYVEALGGGMGARADRDGMDGVQVHITNTSNLPVEAMEMEYPLRVLRHGLVPDSGGPGRFRGGLAIVKEIQALAPVLFSAHADRHRLPPWGLMGGLPGGRGRFVLNPGTPQEQVLRSKLSGLLIRRGEVLRVQTAGGGGFGPPWERDPARVAQDCVQGKV